MINQVVERTIKSRENRSLYVEKEIMEANRGCEMYNGAFLGEMTFEDGNFLGV
jgi:hypothetical protein